MHIAYIISSLQKSLEFEWLSEKIDKSKYRLTFILLNPEHPCELSEKVEKAGATVHYIPFLGKKDYPLACWRCYRLLSALKPDAVHAHLFDASLLGLLSARLAGIKVRIYTRHHSSWHHVYFPSMVKYDRLINTWATHIVSISEGVEKILVEREGVPLHKISIIHHGVDVGRFDRVGEEEVKALKAQYNPQGRGPAIGVISRYTEWKGVQYIIPAFKALLQEYPQAMLLLANAQGDYAGPLRALLAQLPPGSYHEIAFEPNLFALYKLFDVFVHAPIDDHSEAFGQIYIEALAAGIPSVFTLSGAALGFAKHKENCFVADYASSDSILEGMRYLLQHDTANMKASGKALVSDFYHVHKKIEKLEALYEGALKK